MALSKNAMFLQDNIFAYLRWRGDLSFNDAHFCEVDNLLLSVVCYLNFQGIVPSQIHSEPMLFSEAVEAFCQLSASSRYMGAILPKETFDLAKAMASSRRFRHTKVVGFVNEVDEEKHIQFCAMTFLLPDGSVFVAYRGTDDTIVGWKEDFMLAFTSPVPAQKRAKEYLEAVAKVYPDAPIRVGGHSKGGNLAFYAAVKADPGVQSRIVAAFSNDGPGFMPEFFESPGYLAIEKRLVSFIPQSSIVGGLLHTPKHFHVIHSTNKTVLQHDPFSWTVVGPHFRHERTRSAFGVRADVTFERWLEKLTLKERETFIHKTFGLLSTSGAKTLSDIVTAKLKSIRAIITSFARLEKEDREMMFRIMHQLFRASHESRELTHAHEHYADPLLPAPKKQEKPKKAAQEKPKKPKKDKKPNSTPVAKKKEKAPAKKQEPKKDKIK